LPAEVDVDKAGAEFHDGVLEIRLPKLEHTKRRLLKVA
jgi:HSP20 family molecular chaperone IbpA